MNSQLKCFFFQLNEAVRGLLQLIIFMRSGPVTVTVLKKNCFQNVNG